MALPVAPRRPALIYRRPAAGPDPTLVLAGDVQAHCLKKGDEASLRGRAWLWNGDRRLPTRGYEDSETDEGAPSPGPRKKGEIGSKNFEHPK